MRIYLAGPMRGIPEFNFPAFAEATAKLRALGYEVFSPAEKDLDDGFDPTGMTGEEPIVIGTGGLNEALAMDLDYICRYAEAVVLLPGWENSPGVNSEMATARALGKPVWVLGNVLRCEVGFVEGVVKFLDQHAPAAVEEIQSRMTGLPPGLVYDDKGIHGIPTVTGTWSPSIPALDGSFGRWGHEADPETLKGIVGRNFEGGAYRDTEDGKLDYEGFLSPAVLQAFAGYMHKHRVQSDGQIRDSDNWQKGMPLDVYMKSMFRHFMDVWTLHRYEEPVDPDVHLEALMALLFNVQGYAFELLRKQDLADRFREEFAKGEVHVLD